MRQHREHLRSPLTTERTELLESPTAERPVSLSEPAIWIKDPPPRHRPRPGQWVSSEASSCATTIEWVEWVCRASRADPRPTSAVIRSTGGRRRADARLGPQCTVGHDREYGVLARTYRANVHLHDAACTQGSGLAVVQQFHQLRELPRHDGQPVKLGVLPCPCVTALRSRAGCTRYERHGDDADDPRGRLLLPHLRGAATARRRPAGRHPPQWAVADSRHGQGICSQAHQGMRDGDGEQQDQVTGRDPGAPRRDQRTEPDRGERGGKKWRSANFTISREPIGIGGCRGVGPDGGAGRSRPRPPGDRGQRPGGPVWTTAAG